MNTFLFILKMIGIGITGYSTVGGIFGRKAFEEIEIQPNIITSPPTPPRIQRQITKHGVRALFGAAIGVLVSLVAQGLEQSLSNKRARESDAQTRAQMLLLSKSLSNLESLISRFNTIQVDVVFEVRRNNTNYDALRSDLDKFFASEIGGARDIEILKNFSNEEVPRHAYFEAFELTSLTNRIYVERIPGLIEHTFFWRPPEEVWMRMGFNQSKQSSSALAAMLTATNVRADLTIDCITNVISGWLIYDSKTRGIFIEWKGFRFPRESWLTNRRITGISDLNECQIFFTLSDEAFDYPHQQLFLDTEPKWLSIRFDAHTAVVTNFVTRTGGPRYHVFEAMLPTSEAILSDSTYSPNPYY